MISLITFDLLGQPRIMPHCAGYGAGLVARSISALTPLILSRSSLSLSQPLWRTPKFRPSYVAQLSSSTAEKPRIEYKYISGVELLENYEPGGYHPVMDRTGIESDETQYSLFN